jgi:hypothetical protein
VPEECCRVNEAGSRVCELPAPGLARPVFGPGVCAVCGERGKPVQGQTVKSLLAVSLRAVRAVSYYFCRNRTCPVVYFSEDGQDVFTVDQVRERVYQKESDSGNVLVCYCFQYSVDAVRLDESEAQQLILEDINAGIQAGQCACDLRNPQGSCCLGNVRALSQAPRAAINPPGCAPVAEVVAP